jgi:hypothetical protein
VPGGPVFRIGTRSVFLWLPISTLRCIYAGVLRDPAVHNLASFARVRMRSGPIRLLAGHRWRERPLWVALAQDRVLA